MVGHRCCLRVGIKVGRAAHRGGAPGHHRLGDSSVVIVVVIVIVRRARLFGYLHAPPAGHLSAVDAVLMVLASPRDVVAGRRIPWNGREAVWVRLALAFNEYCPRSFSTLVL
jgi:hypothetical protein